MNGVVFELVVVPLELNATFFEDDDVMEVREIVDSMGGEKDSGRVRLRLERT
jgi:hypothetical protein